MWSSKRNSFPAIFHERTNICVCISVRVVLHTLVVLHTSKHPALSVRLTSRLSSHGCTPTYRTSVFLLRFWILLWYSLQRPLDDSEIWHVEWIPTLYLLAEGNAVATYLTKHLQCLLLTEIVQLFTPSTEFWRINAIISRKYVHIASKNNYVINGNVKSLFLRDASWSPSLHVSKIVWCSFQIYRYYKFAWKVLTCAMCSTCNLNAFLTFGPKLPKLATVSALLWKP